MSTRLSIITTRTGDDGTTGLADSTRLSKAANRIHLIGEVDELNSHIGVWRTETLPKDVDTLLNQIQHQLFDLGAELCLPGHEAIQPDHLLFLEATITRYNAELGPLTEFILPGGCKAAAYAHIARTVCRRVERTAVTELESSAAHLRTEVLQYLNRLSDLCFVLARYLNRHANHPDILWQAAGSARPNQR